MDEKEVVDVSPFMLFEASGDSEVHSEVNTASMGLDMDFAGEDDAQSCNCDILDCGNIVEFGEFDDLEDAQNGDYHVDDDEDEEAIHQDWTGDDDDDDDDDDVVLSSVAKGRQHKKPKVCADSTMKFMNEMERSKLFWEACLAS